MENKKTIVKKEVFYLVISAAFSYILAEFGVLILKEFPNEPHLGIAIIFLAFIILYFSYYIIQINENKDEIRTIKNEMMELQKNEEVKQELLNTLKDIVILKKVSKIK